MNLDKSIKYYEKKIQQKDNKGYKDILSFLNELKMRREIGYLDKTSKALSITLWTFVINVFSLAIFKYTSGIRDIWKGLGCVIFVLLVSFIIVYNYLKE